MTSIWFKEAKFGNTYLSNTSVACPEAGNIPMKMTTLDNYSLMPFNVQLIYLCFDSMPTDFIIWIPPQRCPQNKLVIFMHISQAT